MEEIKIEPILAAKAFVERIGMTVVDVNRSTKFGDVPLVVLDNEQGELVHVSVRVLETIDEWTKPTPATLKKYNKQIQEVLKQSGLPVEDTRIDLVDIVPVDDNRAILRHTRNVRP